MLIRFREVLDLDEEQLPRITHDLISNGLSCQALQDGDVIIADTAEDETVGKCTELRRVHDRKVVSGLHTMACRPSLQFGEGYLGYYLNSPSFHDQLLPLMQGIKVTSVSRSAIDGAGVSFPSIDEQRQIGAFFQQLDNLIALHQRNFPITYCGIPILLIPSLRRESP